MCYLPVDQPHGHRGSRNSGVPIAIEKARGNVGPKPTLPDIKELRIRPDVDKGDFLTEVADRLDDDQRIAKARAAAAKNAVKPQ
jgi:hypothetical protein